MKRNIVAHNLVVWRIVHKIGDRALAKRLGCKKHKDYLLTYLLTSLLTNKTRIRVHTISCIWGWEPLEALWWNFA